MKIISSWSGGKDSALACYRAMKEGHTVECLLNLVSAQEKRCCFHGTDARLLADQARCIGIPLVQKEMGEDMGEYERDFKEAVHGLGSSGMEGMVFGDIYLDEHREWVERVCGDIGIVPLEPLWNSDPRGVIDEFLDAGFRAVIVSCREELGKDFVGREVDREALARLERLGLCPCGERGEYHTIVVDGPIFSKRIRITKAEPVLKEGFWRHWFLDIREYELEDR
ncbi:MAG TPA: diphthine--ammonia ligase [Spirochaetota bacterium]|nr:diphthine--ammonia ligase [Spirochaetota bacterium]HPC40562.1 diphthine--ammonia ligase [Spirochaetota bacterium]HPL18387.1 diphthine--ammonia ligase [Spirochaetota bacterium]HQF07930.1 diphthine--ammonia ligase [Spirochaetota bacterium]HQH96490.1 diphthine--ammonia ligase [Spirochaetota bacterium]